MKCFSLQPFLCRHPRWVPSSLSTGGLLFVLCNCIAGAYASTSAISASCDGSGDGRCDSTNNFATCDYDGGDCCEFSCSDGAVFSCGVVGYTCLDLSAPEYVDPEDDTTTDFFGEWGNIAFVSFCIFVVCWCCLCDKLYGMDRGESGEESREESGFEESKKKTASLVFAWLLLVVELGVALVLYFKGEGRISVQRSMIDPEYPLLPAQDMCVIGEGPQLVSYATFYRGGVDVISQLILWGFGEGLELPERAFVKALETSVNRWTGATSWSENFQSMSECHWSTHLLIIVSLHMVGPLIIDIMALCAFTTGFGRAVFSLAVAIALCCCNCTWSMAPGKGSLIYFVDAVFNGVLGTWANVVQSGYVFGAVFLALPIFEIVYAVAELFVVMNASGLPF